MKVIVSDYDNTFSINIEENVKKIKEFRKNNIFILATGRSYFDLREQMHKYNIEFDYAIINHGATIIDSNNNVIYNCYIDNDIISSLKVDLNIDKVKEGFCTSELLSRNSFISKDITKINVIYKNKEDLEEVKNKLDKYKSIKVYKLRDDELEIISNNTSKLDALMFLENKYNLKNIYTIGDGISDIDMIKKYNGYRMINSKEELKQVTNKEISSVSELISKVNEK